MVCNQKINMTNNVSEISLPSKFWNNREFSIRNANLTIDGSCKIAILRISYYAKQDEQRTTHIKPSAIIALKHVIYFIGIKTLLTIQLSSFQRTANFSNNIKG